MATQEMIFPLAHPPMVVRDSRADDHAARLFFRTPRLSPIKRAIGHFFGKIRRWNIVNKEPEL
jgi:hypothetical protein